MRSSTRFSKIRSILVAAFVASSTIVVLSFDTTAVAAENCSSTRVIGARGSAEPYSDNYYGVGSVNYPVYQRIKSMIPDAQLYGLPYSAVSITPNPADKLVNQYWSSVNTGSIILRKYVEQQVVNCPYQRLIILGYSQGAHVIGDLLATWGTNAAIRNHIAAIVLFGDPRFNPTSPVSTGVYDRNLEGSFGARTISSTWFGTIMSYCVYGDFICNWSTGNFAQCPPWTTKHCGHFSYVSDGWTQAAGTWAANTVKALPSLAPPPQAAPPPPVAGQPQYYSYRVYHTGGAGLRVRSTPSTAGAVVGSVPEGGEVRIVCQVHGQRVVAETDIWDRLTSGGYVYDEYVNTPNIGTFSVRQC